MRTTIAVNSDSNRMHTLVQYDNTGKYCMHMAVASIHNVVHTQSTTALVVVRHQQVQNFLQVIELTYKLKLASGST
jgi:hypothetical protein